MASSRQALRRAQVSDDPQARLMVAALTASWVGNVVYSSLSFPVCTLWVYLVLTAALLAHLADTHSAQDATAAVATSPAAVTRGDAEDTTSAIWARSWLVIGGCTVAALCFVDASSILPATSRLPGLGACVLLCLAAAWITDVLLCPQVGTATGHTRAAGSRVALAHARGRVAQRDRVYAAPGRPVPLLRTSRAVGVASAVLVLCVRPWLADASSRSRMRLARLDLKAALAAAQQATSLDPWNPSAWSCLYETESAISRVPQGLSPAERTHHQKQALQAAIHSRDLQLTSGFTRSQVAAARAALGDAPGAFGAFDKALRLDPCNAPIAWQASEAARQLGDLPRALSYARQPLQHYPGFGPVLLASGHLLVVAGAVDEGRRALRTSLGASWPEPPPTLPDVHGDPRAQALAWLHESHPAPSTPRR